MLGAAWLWGRCKTVGAQRARAPLTSSMAAARYMAGLSTEPKIQEGLQRISKANIRQERQTF